MAKALEQAHGEMIRHRLVVQRYIENTPSPEMGLSIIDDTQDKRALYFALKSGRTLFQDRIDSGPWAPIAKPKQVFNGWMPGPWDRYATVWRCLFEPPSDESASTRMEYFFW